MTRIIWQAPRYVRAEAPRWKRGQTYTFHSLRPLQNCNSGHCEAQSAAAIL